MSLQMFSRSYFVGLILYKETIIEKYTLFKINGQIYSANHKPSRWSKKIFFLLTVAKKILKKSSDL